MLERKGTAGLPNSHACCLNSSVTKPPVDNASDCSAAMSLRRQASRITSSLGSRTLVLGSSSGESGKEGQGCRFASPKTGDTGVPSSTGMVF